MREISSPIASDRGKFSPQAAQSLTSSLPLLLRITSLYDDMGYLHGGV